MLLITLVGMILIPLLHAQTQTITLYDGDELNVKCECSQSPIPTEVPPPTSLPTPTDVPPTDTPPPPTPSPSPSAVWHGVVRSPQDAWPVMHDQLSASVVELLIGPSTADSSITASLNQAQALGLRVLLHIYDRERNTAAPWYLDGSSWHITDRGIEILALIEDHPAVWALYTLHEPFDSSNYHADADSQRALYTFLHGYTDLLLYTDISSLWYPYQSGEVMSDGMCDICATFPTTFRGEWTSEQCLTETFSRIDNDRYVQQSRMPNSELVFLINTYTLGDGARYRMPTADELDVVRDYMCAGGNVPLYYPWTGYDLSLDDVPALWPIIAQGCGEPGPTPTPSPTNTPLPPTETPGPTNTPLPPTDTPAPTITPGPSDAIVIDHTTVDAGTIPQAWLDAARVQATFFNHRSIGNNILDGIAALQSQNPGRYSITVRYSTGTTAGINHYMAGSNQLPYSKITGFASNVKDGHDVAMMKFCVGDFEPWTSYDAEDIWLGYRDMMIEQQTEHPGVMLVWWTSPLTTQSDARGLASFEEFNDYVRAYVNTNGGVLFDIADIESHDLSNNPISSGGHEAMWNGYSTDGAHLNATGSQRVASALWWLLARVAGWEG